MEIFWIILFWCILFLLGHVFISPVKAKQGAEKFKNKEFDYTTHATIVLTVLIASFALSIAATVLFTLSVWQCFFIALAPHLACELIDWSFRRGQKN